MILIVTRDLECCPNPLISPPIYPFGSRKTLKSPFPLRLWQLLLRSELWEQSEKLSLVDCLKNHPSLLPAISRSFYRWWMPSGCIFTVFLGNIFLLGQFWLIAFTRSMTLSVCQIAPDASFRQWFCRQCSSVSTTLLRGTYVATRAAVIISLL